MTFPTRLAIAAAPAILFALACAGEDIGLGDGTITVHNDESREIAVLISDTDDCVIGMHGSVNPQATRSFDIMTDEQGQSYFCINEEVPFPVEDGGHYAIRGGALVKDTTYEEY